MISPNISIIVTTGSLITCCVPDLGTGLPAATGVLLILPVIAAPPSEDVGTKK